jgi:two-component system chemotaxis response regulator CheY
VLNKFSNSLKNTLKVLVIDDVAYMRTIMVTMLENIGITNIVEASDGKQALELIKSNKFNLVLCDWNMPELDGISLLKIIRLSHKTTTLPFIMVTTNQKLDDVKECISSGVSGFLLKPFSLESLDKVLDDSYQSILLHHKTLNLLNDEILKALNNQ